MLFASMNVTCGNIKYILDLSLPECSVTGNKRVSVLNLAHEYAGVLVGNEPLLFKTLMLVRNLVHSLNFTIVLNQSKNAAGLRNKRVTVNCF